jgi:hypothetical protein
MHAAVAEPEIPGLRGVTLCALDVVDGPARVVVSGVAFHDLRLAAVDGEKLVVVVVRRVVGMARTVPDDLMIPIAAKSGVAAGMPFADLRSVVAVLTKNGGPEAALLRDRMSRRDRVASCAWWRCRIDVVR